MYVINNDCAGNCYNCAAEETDDIEDFDEEDDDFEEDEDFEDDDEE